MGNKNDELKMKTNQVTGYKTSRDYKELVRLMEYQNVVCLVDFGPSNNPHRDVAQANHVAETGEWQIFTRGFTYIWAWSKADFRKFCEMYNVEFLIPNEN